MDPKPTPRINLLGFPGYAAVLVVWHAWCTVLLVRIQSHSLQRSEEELYKLNSRMKNSTPTRAGLTSGVAGAEGKRLQPQSIPQ